MKICDYEASEIFRSLGDADYDDTLRIEDAFHPLEFPEFHSGTISGVQKKAPCVSLDLLATDLMLRIVATGWSSQFDFRMLKMRRQR